MAIIAAPTVEPLAIARHKSDLVPIRGPGLEFVLRCHSAVNAWSLLLAQWLIFASCRGVSMTMSVAKISITQSATLVGLILHNTAILARYAAWRIWNTKRVKRWRRKIVFEFMVVVLGPGNLFIVLVMWPGWILLGIVVWSVLGWVGW